LICAEPVDCKIRTIHAAQIATATFFRIDYVRWVISLGIERGRERKYLGGTELHAEPTGLTPLHHD